MEEKKLTLEEVQKVTLDIVKYIDQVCARNKIRYSLFYGSLLGAVREGGIIPWDDDIDIAMPRPDFERFVEFCQNNADAIFPFKLFFYSTEKNYVYPIARFCDMRFKVKYYNTVDYGLGTFVDIYPIDGCGNSSEEATNIIKRFKPYDLLIELASMKKCYKSTRGFLATIPKFCCFVLSKIIGSNNLLRIADKKAKSVKYDDSKYVGCTVWDNSGKAYFKKEIFENLIKIRFEDTSLFAIKDFDVVLKNLYGDYMTPPPIDCRKPMHGYDVIKITNEKNMLSFETNK